MVMVAEQLNTDYLLVAAMIFVAMAGLLGSVLLCSMYQELREGTVRLWALLSSVAPVALVGMALWSLVLPLAMALLVATSTGLVALAAVLLLPHGPWRIMDLAPSRLRVGLAAQPVAASLGTGYGGAALRQVADFLAGSFWGVVRMGLTMAPGILIGGAPDWLLWFSLAGILAAAVHAWAPLLAPKEPGRLAEVSWGTAQGFVLGSLPALMLVTSRAVGH
ncbi:hypothetical protein [Azospirillum sp. SYSU D00513]|uniref:hypothetical protein n=1 Tax=Azospirillum sp. SYSU D00513 TaxID=2812561 RepID=UPI001A9786E6|nr:hypothetical protein [Azospirillum sp. SYSU D00513]